MAQEAVLSHVTTVFFESSTLFERLLEFLYPGHDSPVSVADDFFARRLFESEEDNNFQECLFMTQMGALFLEKLLLRRLKCEDTALQTRAWAETMHRHLVEQLHLLVEEIRRKSSRYLWSPFVTYQPDLFLLLYRLTATLLVTSSPCPAPVRKLVLERFATSSEERSSWCHQIIQNLDAIQRQFATDAPTTATSVLHTSLCFLK